MCNFVPGHDIKLLASNVFWNNFRNLKSLQENKYALK